MPDGRVHVRLRNDSQTLAFQIALRALDEHAAPVAPAFWSDNYVSLLPGETRTLHGSLLVARRRPDLGDRGDGMESSAINESR